MDTIKIRAWDKFKKRMCYFGPRFDVNDDYNTLTFVTESGMNGPIGDHGAMDRYILDLYIGQRDKNGKEIYAGDILKLKDGTIGKVVWKDYMLCILVRVSTDLMKMFRSKNPWAEMSFWAWGADSEVIGNIHENVDLLK